MNDIEYHLYEEAKAGRMTRQQLLVRGSLLGLSATAMTTILAACGSGSSSGSSGGTASAGTIQRGGTFNLGVTQPSPAQVDPVTMYSEGGIATCGIAGEYLCFPNPDYTLDPRLATSWTPSNGGKTWTFAIRQGVKFQDGSPLTANDVATSFERLTDPKSESAALSAFAGVLSHGNTEASGTNVVFHLDRAYAAFPYLVSAFNYNTVILPANYAPGSFTKGGIGTGPYILKTFVPNQQATYTKNPNYWASGMPYMDSVVLKFYSDTPPQVAPLQAGELDAMVETPYTDAKALFGAPGIVVLENPSSQYRTLQMRVDQAPFNSLQLRQAVAYALDRPTIVQTLFGGKAQVGNDHGFAPIFPDSPSTSDVPQRTQDTAKAKSLVQQAGVSSVTLTTEQYLEIPQYATLIKEAMAPAGLTVNLNVEPQPTYYGSGATQPWLQVPFGITDWAARGTPGQLIDPAFLCSSVPNDKLSNSGAWNSAHWCNTDFTNLMHQYEAEVDDQKRKQLAIQAAKIQNDQVPDVISYWIDELRATSNKVHGFPKGPITQVDCRAVWKSS